MSYPTTLPEPTPLPSYAVSKADAVLISRIAERAVLLAERYGRRAEFLGVCANLTACHANGCALDLAALLAADDAAFVHDVWGIGRHLDRVTGALARFRPRFAASAAVSAGRSKAKRAGRNPTKGLAESAHRTAVQGTVQSGKGAAA